MNAKVLAIVALFTCFGASSIYGQEPDLSRIKGGGQKVQVWLDYCAQLRLNKNEVKDNFVLLQRAGLKGVQFVPPEDAIHKARFYAYAALGYYYQVKFDSAQNYFYLSLHEALKADAPELMTDAYTALIPLNIQLRQAGKADSCKAALQKILDTTHNLVILQNGYSALGSYYQHLSYYSTAQEYILKSINLRKKSLDTTQNELQKAEYAIQCYLLSKIYAISEPLYKKSLEILMEGQPYSLGSPSVSTRYLSSFVEIYSLLGIIDSALHYKLLLDERTRNSSVVPSELVSANLNIAKYYIEKNKADLSRPYITMAGTLAAQSKSPILIYQAQLWKGRYMEAIGNFKEAIAALTLSLPVAQQINKEQYLEGMKYMAIALKKAGNLSEAIHYYEQYNLLSDSLTKEMVSRNFADEETRYQTQEKQNEIISLYEKNKLNMLELQQASNTRSLMSMGLVSLGVFCLLLYFIYKNKEKLNHTLNSRNTQLDILNHELSVANDTKAKLFGIIGHDLRSPVSRIVQMLKVRKDKPDLFDADSKKNQEEHLRIAAEHLLETMEDLLLWGKSQMKNFAPQLRMVKGQSLIEQDLALLREEINERKLNINLIENEAVIYHTDENVLSVIVRNLLLNAISNSVVGSEVGIALAEDRITISNESTAINANKLNLLLSHSDVSSRYSGFGLQMAKDLGARIGIKFYFTQKEKYHISAVMVWN